MAPVTPMRSRQGDVFHTMSEYLQSIAESWSEGAREQSAPEKKQKFASAARMALCLQRLVPRNLRGPDHAMRLLLEENLLGMAEEIIILAPRNQKLREAQERLMTRAIAVNFLR